MDFIFEQIRTGGDRNFSYLIGDRSSGTGVCIDPANDPEKVLERSRAGGLDLSHIIITHGHPDHINGNDVVKSSTNAKVSGYVEASFDCDYSIKDKDSLKVGKFELEFFYTPGHADDHIVVYLKEFGILISGDLLFVGKVGGTSNELDAEKQWNSLNRVLEILPEHTTVWPGHDFGCRPSSTLALEKYSNPFLRCKSFNEFLNLKNEWKSCKQKMGLI